MKENNKIKQDEINDFLKEADNSGKEKSASTNAYTCPVCHGPLLSRHQECPRCHYKGYVPMTEEETKRIRSVLFLVIMAIAIALLIILR